MCPGQALPDPVDGARRLCPPPDAATWGMLPPDNQQPSTLCPAPGSGFVQSAMFTCVNGTCQPDPAGCLTSTDCAAVCSKPPPPVDATYGCDATTGQCRPGLGQQTQDACQAAGCPKPPPPVDATYGCDTTTGQCRPGLGQQTQDACQAAGCSKPPPPVDATFGCDAQTGTCKRGGGSQTESACMATCAAQPSPGMGWACQPQGGCAQVAGGAWPTQAACSASCLCAVSWRCAGLGPGVPPKLRGYAWPSGTRPDADPLATATGFGTLRLAADAVVDEVGQPETRALVFANELAETIWVGIIGDATFKNGEEGWGGFELRPLEARIVPVSSHFQGKAWGRTDCKLGTDGALTCHTGNCGIANGQPGLVDCSTKGNEPPTTLAEFNFDTPNGNDYVDVSVVDGMNLTMLVQPYVTANGQPRFKPGPTCGVPEGPQTCKAAMVAYRPNIKDPKKGDWCPPELRYVANNKVYCTSPCKAVTAAVTQGDAYLQRLDTGNADEARRALAALQRLGTGQDPVHPTGSGDRTLFNLVCSQCSTRPCQPGAPCGCGKQADCAYGCSPYSTDPIASPPSQRAPARPEGVPVGGCAAIGTGGTQVCDPWKDGIDKATPWRNVPADHRLSEMPDWPIPPSRTDVTYGSAIAAALLDGVYTWQFRDNTSTYQCCSASWLCLFTDEPMKARNWPPLLPAANDGGDRKRPREPVTSTAKLVRGDPSQAALTLLPPKKVQKRAGCAIM